jgi:hypothetical protein
MDLFPAAQDALEEVIYNPQLPNPFEGWQKGSTPAQHIAQAILHLHRLQTGDRSAPHLSQAILRLLMALEMRVLAAHNGHFVPRKKCSRCHYATPLRGQAWCQPCFNSYDREQRAKRAAQQAAEAIAPTAIQVAAEAKPSVTGLVPVRQTKIGFG